MTERRNARLMFALELRAGLVDEADLFGSDEVRAAVRPGRIPPLPLRIGQVLARRAAGWRPDQAATAVAVRARRAVLGIDAAAAPRVLLRMDEYPHWLAGREPGRVGDEAFAPWQEVLAGARCPHLVAVVPRIAEDPERRTGPSRELDEVECRRLEALRGAGAEFGLHGYEHRTRLQDPRLRTELGHRRPREVGALLDRSLQELSGRTGLRPQVLVPPFNAFGARALPEIAKRFPVVTGGPESMLRVGFQPTPSWLGDTVFLPAYTPLYGTAAEVLPDLDRLVCEESGLWTPIVLHWGWEAERGWKDLERLVEYLAPLARPWSEFLDAVEMSR